MNGQFISKRYVDSSDNLKCYNLQLKNTRELIDAAMTCIPYCFVCCLEKKNKKPKGLKQIATFIYITHILIK